MHARTVACVLVVLSSATIPATALGAVAAPSVDADVDGVPTDDSVSSESTRSSDASAVADVEGEETVREVVTLHRLPDDPGTVEVTLEYRLPESVTELEVDSPYVRSRAVAVESTDGFDRGSLQGFVWDESNDSPTITLEVNVATGSFDNRELGVETDDWAFAYLPDPFVNWRYSGSEPTFEGTHTVASEGHATDSFGVDGGGSIEVRRVGDANLTTVVVPDARLEASVDDLAEIYRIGGRELDVGTRYENTSLFVLPSDVFERRSAVGTTVLYSVWVQDEFSAVDSIESTPAHEYVHTRMGTFRGPTGRWLTEASAEYYGTLLSLNADNGNWASFQESLAVERESISSSTLTVPLTWRNSFVPYEKGSRVLAALDAQIRDRTDGSKTLQDVLAYRFEDDDPYENLRTYEGFADAVVAVTDDPEMRDWLDRYVDGDEVPPVPDDPDLFVMNESMDSDGDGVANGLEVATNPFDADSDGDGVDDDMDAYPTDASRSRPADVTETNATANATTNATNTTTNETTNATTNATNLTNMTTNATTTDTDETTPTTSANDTVTDASTATATTTAATATPNSTLTTTDSARTSGSRTAGNETNSSTSTANRTVADTSTDDQGSGPTGGSAGFGPKSAVVGVASALFLTARRSTGG